MSAKKTAASALTGLLGAALLALASAPAAASGASGSVTATAERDYGSQARDIARLAERVVEAARIPSIGIAVVQGDRVLVQDAYGVTDTVSRQPAGPDTAYRLASLSKAFAGAVTGQLVQEGALSWDTRLVDQLPAFKLKDLEGAQALTARDILSHRVGLPHNTYDRDLEADEPYQVLANRLATAPLACKPGDCYAYQNIAFSLIGDLVFAATGDFYSHQVEKRIFHPLGMYTATYGRQALENTPSWARPHVRGRGGWVPVRPKESYYRVPPAAGVNASPRDMAQWAIAQLGHRPEVLPPAVLEETQRAQVSTPSEIRHTPWRHERLRDAHYGLGWRIYDYAGHKLVFHGGAVQGYRTLIALLPDRDVGIVVLWNSESAVPTGLMPTFIDSVLGLPGRDWVQVDRVRRRNR
ncbi:serine hydrolase domain-containing protein [Coralloluteibacterium stylophorae]|uniref:Beta-lactamase family protein n=1 Tax=Coralloluteibacterium stylophorae TaxID=1776034 RepID=A0A8J7VXH3_9GAMM|nr:serine hydrolase domain-containing protein [Coralloluteibacterium stylophorae]MBS7456059.1 beta-lactamase family protein [Coralloluteibacterium stylophorae]